MILQKELLFKSRDFGLNSYEVKLWTALISCGVATAGELSDIANVPRSRSYDVLESLERKGFVMLKLGKPIKYVAVPPEEVIERVKNNIQEESKIQTERIENMKESKLLNELSLLYKQGIKQIDPFELTSTFRGKKNTYYHLNFLIKNAKKEISFFTGENSAVDKIKATKINLLKAHNRGVSIKIIAPLSTENIQTVKELTPFVEIKQLVNNNEVSTRFCIVDNENISFMVTDEVKTHPAYDFGIWVNEPSFVKNFSTFFNHYWKKGKAVV